MTICGRYALDSSEHQQQGKSDLLSRGPLLHCSVTFHLLWGGKRDSLSKETSPPLVSSNRGVQSCLSPLFWIWLGVNTPQNPVASLVAVRRRRLQPSHSDYLAKQSQRSRETLVSEESHQAVTQCLQKRQGCTAI